MISAPWTRQRPRAFRELAVVADLDAEAHAIHLEDGQRVTRREVELFVGARAALRVGGEDGRDVGLAVGADMATRAVEDGRRVVVVLARLLSEREDERHVVAARGLQRADR